MEPYDCGYAPTVVKHRGRFWLLAFGSNLFVSDSPLGPFEDVGPLRAPDGSEFRAGDPMLFSDDDGRLYLYFGCGWKISGVELDAADPTRLLADPATMFEADTANHPWERMGACNTDPNYSWVEGSWMFKRGGVYYLTYAAPGTRPARSGPPTAWAPTRAARRSARGNTCAPARSSPAAPAS